MSSTSSPNASSPGAFDQPSSTTLGDRRRRPRTFHSVRFHQVTSADGTVVEAWTNAVEEGPVVLLCNGLGTNPYAWPALLDPECGVRVVSWNHRGVGRSARPQDRARVGMEAFVEDALAVMDAFDLDRCVVAGWSIGVNTAFELALRHPERVSGLFAVAGVPGATFASMGAPLFIPRPLRRPISVATARTMKLAAPVLTPVARRIPMGPITTTALRFSGFMFPTARPSGGTARGARVPDHADRLVHAPRAARLPTRPRVPVGGRLPAVSVAGRYDVLADARTCAAPRSGSTGDVPRAAGNPLPAAGATRRRGAAAARAARGRRGLTAPGLHGAGLRRAAYAGGMRLPAVLTLLVALPGGVRG